MFQKPTPGRVPHRFGGALKGSCAALEPGTLITTIFVLFSCWSWAHLGGVLGPKLGVLGAKTTKKTSAKTTHDASKMHPRQPKIRFSQKNVRKNEPFELGWHFPFDFNPILAQKYIPEY